MVRPPKNIQWWWSPQKPLKICNGLFTFLDPRYVDLYALEEDVLQRIVEDISRCYLIFHSSLKYLDMILSSFGDMILTRDSIVNLKTIVDHCPQNFENHRKTIGSNGWTPQKTFNGDGPTLSKPLKNHWRQWWPKKKTLTIPSPWKIDHRCGLVFGFHRVWRCNLNGFNLGKSVDVRVKKHKGFNSEDGCKNLQGCLIQHENYKER